MKLDLDRQPKGRSQLALAGRVELALGDGRPGEVALAGDLTVQNLQARCLLNGSLRASGRAECSRCLGEFDAAWEVPVAVMVLRDTESDEDEGETLLILQRDGEVDLTEALRECAVLAYPHSPVCREDCRGLCPACGIDRNADDCGCEEEDTDPRWEGLP